MKKRIGMYPILREEKCQWRKNIACTIIARAVFESASGVKSLTSLLTSFLRCYNDIENLLEYSGHAWPNPSKIILSTCKKLLCLSTCKALTS